MPHRFLVSSPDGRDHSCNRHTYHLRRTYSCGRYIRLFWLDCHLFPYHLLWSIFDYESIGYQAQLLQCLDWLTYQRRTTPRNSSSGQRYCNRISGSYLPQKIAPCCTWGHCAKAYRGRTRYYYHSRVHHPQGHFLCFYSFGWASIGVHRR